MKRSNWLYVAVVLVPVVFSAAAAWGSVKMPQIVSHRGESLDRPENTMAAFQLAFERGVDGVECDVYATADGVPVIIHDSTTGRTAGSSVDLTVTDSTWDQLKDVQVGQFGSWASTEWATQTIPKLEDYLALLSENETTVCVVELKGNGANNLVANVVAAVQAQPLATKDRVVFIAFDASLISAVRQALPQYEAWLLLNSGTYTGDDFISRIQACGATGVDVIYNATFSAEDVAAVKSAGYTFAVWTCDNDNTAFSLAKQGVDAITTNRGGAMKTALAALVADENRWDEIFDDGQPRGATLWDVGSYVQNGLVGHFDGIRNAGANLPHQSSATIWKNLVPGKPDAAFVRVAATDGNWTKDGYWYDGAVYTQVDSPGIALGTTFTVELATDVDYTVQNAGSKNNTSYWPNFFAFPNDFCLYFNNCYNKQVIRTNVLTFKTEPYGASSGGSSRPTLTWGGKYLTAMFADNGMKYLVEGTELDNGMARAATVAVPETRMTWGGTANGSSQRYAIGEFHSVRMYNRALSEAELAQNRMVDEMRFRNVGGNVIVASNVSGLEGTEISGVYTVNGTHTFTAQEQTSGNGCTWAPAGYKLELWDADKSKWDTLGTYSGAAFDYTNCTARAKVRLTWNWALSNGVKKYDADDYVQAGLLMNFDGIRNAGLDQPHDSAATVWRNLAALGDASLATLNADKPGAWIDTGYDLKGGDYFQIIGNMRLASQGTIQIAADYNESEQSVSWPTFFGTPADVFNVYPNFSATSSSVTDRGDRLNFKADNTTSFNSSNRSMLQPWDGRIINAILDYNRSSLTATEKASWRNGTHKNDVGLREYFIGVSGNSNSDKAARILTGRIHAVRVYDRVLTEAELRHNLEIDHCRFYSGAGHSTETDLVEVRSELPAISLNGEVGCYLVRGTGSLSLTAPASAVVGNCTYKCAGYRIETWNPAARLWTNGSVTAGATQCVVNGTSGAANRRVTWLWTLENGLRTADDYDVYDYVQDGLVGHYDGIRNRGASNGHVLKGMYWRDLSYRDNAMLTASNSCHGAWVDKGYGFDAAKTNCTRMVESVNLGLESTMQGVMDVNPSAQTQSYPNYFAVNNDYGLFTRGTGNVLEWKLDTWCYKNNARAKYSGWTGKYVNTVITSSKVYLVEGTTLNNSANRTVYKEIDGLRWSLGAAGDFGSIASRCMTGTYYAARFYDRALTEAELERNRKVDEIRYRGNFANYRNVVVVNEQPVEGATVESSVADGEYEVTGEWTFSAATVTIEGKVYRPRYILETWDGTAWGEPMRGYEDHYTYRDSDTPVRLTWKWLLHQGTMILVQ